jgi:hypothetical protein
MTFGRSPGRTVPQGSGDDAEPPHDKRSRGVEADPTVLVREADAVQIGAGPAIDETGEASFPASDPPACWTWDIAGRPPGSGTG